MGKFLRHKGKTFPDELGGNCVEQAEKLLKVLKEAGLVDDGDLLDLCDKNYVHAVLLARKRGTRYFIDPGLLQLQPVNLTELGTDNPAFVSARPVIKGKNATLRVEVFPEEMMSVEKYSDGLTVFTELFDLSDGRSKREVSDPYFLHYNHPQLSYRFQLENEEVRLHLRLKDESVYGQVIPHYGEFFQFPLRKNGVMSAHWDRELLKVERKFGVSKRELVEFMEKAFDIYEEISESARQAA